MYCWSGDNVIGEMCRNEKLIEDEDRQRWLEIICSIDFVTQKEKGRKCRIRHDMAGHDITWQDIVNTTEEKVS